MLFLLKHSIKIDVDLLDFVRDDIMHTAYQ